MASRDDLLTVQAAATLLGVHPVTVRRWTADGRLPDVRTPGGHRRIPRAAAEALRGTPAEATPEAIPEAGNLSDRAWAGHALVHTRFEVQSHPATVWNRSMTEADRARNRESGRRLVGLLLQHVAGGADEAALWDEVRRLAVGYADQMRAHGLAQSEALRATLFFRDALTESTAYYPPQPSADPVALVRKVNRFMNEIQLAIAEAYEAGEAAAAGEATA